MDLSLLQKAMKSVNCYFEKAWVEGHFEVKQNVLLLPGREFEEEELIYVQGSQHHDGVQRCGNAGPEGADEAFEGRVWLLCPPRAFLQDVQALADAEAQAAEEMKKESFGDYSYERRDAAERVSQAEKQLNTWRRMFSVI